MGGDKSSANSRAQRLKRARNLANLSRKEMCNEESGLKVNTLKGWEIGKFGGISKVGAQKVIKRLAQAGVHTSVEWLLFEVGNPPQVNISGEEPAVSSTSIKKSSDHDFMVQELLLWRQHYPYSIDLTIQDDAMLNFSKGDFVAGIICKNITEIINQTAIVVLDTGEKLLREVRHSAKNDSFTLLATNPSTQIENPIIHHATLKSAAIIIWHRKCINPL